MNKASLNGPRARISRSVEHFECIDAEINAFVDSDPYLIRLERQPDGWYVSRIREITSGPPERLGLMFGDFLHNLRSALDNLVWQLVIFNGASPSGGTGGNAFPICSSWPRFADSLFRLRGVSLDHIAFIEALQPYSGRNEPVHEALRIVHHLSNVDKHQVIHPTLAVPTGDEISVPEVEAVDGGPAEAEVEVVINEGKPVEVGTEIGWARVRRIFEPKHGKVKVKGEFSLEIAFGDRLLRAGALPEIGAQIGAIIEHFAPDLDG